MESTRARLDAYDVFIDHPLDIRGEVIHLSERPGLVIELDADYARTRVLDGFGCKCPDLMRCEHLTVCQEGFGC